MNNIKKCSISGVAFTLDEEAYKTLEAYLDSLRASYGETADGKEIVADIEARIAELILTTQEGDRVVQKPLIDNIIAQMGSARDISEESSEEGSAGESSPKEPRIPRRLYRDTTNAKLGGVCAGIGKYFDIDPVWVRLAMFLPLGLGSYWALLPVVVVALSVAVRAVDEEAMLRAELPGYDDYTGAVRYRLVPGAW